MTAVFLDGCWRFFSLQHKTIYLGHWYKQDCLPLYFLVWSVLYSPWNYTVNISAQNTGVSVMVPLSTIFQLYHGSQFYWWSICRKPLTPQVTDIMLYQVTDIMLYQVTDIMLYQVTDIMLYQVTDKLYHIMLYQLTDKLYHIMLYQVTDKLYHIMLYQVHLVWVGFKLTTSTEYIKYLQFVFQ